jgi:lipopolysaccharide export system protein LptA
VATAGLGLDRVRRRKWLTGLLVGGLSVTALAVALTYWISVTRKGQPARIPPSPPADVRQQLSGYTFTRSDEGRAIFTVHAARTVAFREGKTTVLEDVMVEVFGHTGGRRDILRTHRCQYNSQSGDFFSSGPVEIELNAQSRDLPGTGLRGKHPVLLETSKVSFHQEGSLAETDQPVKFRVGPAAGTARGLVYATGEGWLELKHDVAIDLHQGSEQTPQPPIRLTASELRYDREGATVTLAGPVEVTQGGRRAVAGRAQIALDNRNRVTQVDLEDDVKAFDVNEVRSVEIGASHVRGDFDAASGQLRHLTAEQDVTGESKAKGSTSRLTAQQLDLDLAGNPPQPLKGVATGNVHLALESQPFLKLPESNTARSEPEKKDLTAAEVRFDFRPDSQSLKDAETVGAGTLIVSPADPKVGERVITAGQFQMTFDARSRIEALRGLAPTRVVFRPPATAPAGSVAQESLADRLDAIFDAGTQTLREVRQSGNFQFHDGDRQASAEEARYDALTQSLLLLGHPQVWDANSRIKCQRVIVDLRTDTSTGEGKVQAVHLPSLPAQPASAGRAGPPPGNRPAAVPASPTNVLADRMVAERQSQTVHYEGHVRAWQGTDVIESSALDVYRSERRVSSGSQVVTSYLQPASLVKGEGAAPHAAGDTRPVTVRADFLEYLDQGRRARYHGNVRLLTENTTLQSDRLDVYFTQGDTVEGSEVDHAEAEGHVKVTQPGRRGSGDHAEYFAGPGKIVLTGGPPSLFDEEKGFATGQRLTFFIHDDRLFVDGGEKSPSLTEHRVAQ